MRALTKTQAELLLAAIDTDDLHTAYLRALRFVLGSPTSDSDATVLTNAASAAGWSPATLDALTTARATRNPEILSTLAIDLCELRRLKAPAAKQATCRQALRADNA